MKLTIDTKEDSAEDIKKIISFLNTIIGETQEIKSNAELPNLGDFFGDSTAADLPKVEPTQVLEENKECPEENKIEFY